MGVITPSTFDPLKRYCNVRLQQGVPIVDSDLNELDDIRKFELRAYLKWFVGDGVPDGNDGFRIMPYDGGQTDDVFIQGGKFYSENPEGTTQEFKALHNAGRCIIDGLDVIIENSIRFKQQALYGQSGLGAPQIDPIPAVNGEVIVYLDVWERLVSIQEDPDLVHQDLGTESCVRTKREWAVRARAGNYAPEAGESDHLPGHSYLALAMIERRLVNGLPERITQADIHDLRPRALLTPPSTLIPDVLGVDPASYRRGQGQPLMNMRRALNSILRGELPGGYAYAISPHSSATDSITTAALPRSDGNMDLLRVSDRTGSTQVYGSRVVPALETGGTYSDMTLNTGTAYGPHAARLPTGEIVFVYANVANNGDIFFRRGGTLEDLYGAATTVVSSNANIQKACFVAVTGTLAAGGDVVFFWLEQVSGNYRWTYRRRRYTSTWAEANAFWVDGAGVALSGTNGADGGLDHVNVFHAAVDGDGVIWIAFRTVTNDLRPIRFSSTAGSPVTEYASLTGAPPLTTGSPFVLVDGTSSVWYFWHGLDNSQAHVYYRRYLKSTSNWETVATKVLDTATTPGAATLCAARDRLGGIWLFWTVLNSLLGDRIWFARRDPETGVWGKARMLSGSGDTLVNDSRPCAVIDNKQVLWLFWHRVIGTGSITDVYSRQMLIEL